MSKAKPDDMPRASLQIADELNDIRNQVGAVRLALLGIGEVGVPDDAAMTGLQHLVIDAEDRLKAVGEEIHPPHASDDIDQAGEDDEGVGAAMRVAVEPEAGATATASDPDAELENALHDIRGLASALVFLELEHGEAAAVHGLGRTIGDLAERADDLRGAIARH